MVLVERLLVLGALFISSNALSNATHRKFPDNFRFGVATAAYQIEGAWNESDKGENIWDRLVHTTNYIKETTTGDVACNSYHLYPRDVEMVKDVGFSYYRFSLSWSRILPTGINNKISTEGLNYYNNLINLLIDNNITPVVTLYHWDLPQPLQDMGGWTNPTMEKYFVDFARVAFEAYGDRVKQWVTFNEPMAVCLEGYGSNTKAPAVNLPGTAEYICAHTLIKSHARVYHLYQDVFKNSQNGRVGITLSIGWHEPADPTSAADIEAAETALQFSAGWYGHPIFSKQGDYPEIFQRKIAKRSKEQGYRTSRLPVFTPEEVEYIKGTFDFFGLNHYTTTIDKATDTSLNFPSPSYADDLNVIQFKDPKWPSSASDWLKVVPWGFRKLLRWITNEYNDPEIIVFENGFSDHGDLNDIERISYFHQYLNALLDAQAEGSKVIAYTVWTLMDNFEWLSGYTEKFGLYSVDFNDSSRTRTPRSSVKFFTELMKTRVLSRV